MKSPSQHGLLFLLPWDLHYSGGVNQVVINLYNQAKKSSGWLPVICINEWESQQPRYQEVDSRPTVYVRLRSPWDPRHPFRCLLAFLLSLPSTLLMLRQLVTRNKISVVNVHYPTLSTLLLSLHNKFMRQKVKIVLSFHGLDIEHALKAKGLEHWLWRMLLQSATAITTCSIALKQRVLLLDPSIQDKIEVIHNGLDLEFLQAEQDHTYHLEPELTNKRYLLNVATFEQKKGQDILIEAFNLITKDFPDLLLVLVGRSGPTLDELQKQARDLGLHEKIFIYQDIPHSQTLNFFEQANIFCLPSRDEPFGIVILEAGLFALPVIATRVGGVTEILSSHLYGRLIEPNSPSALAEALQDVLVDEQHAAMLGGNLKEHVLKSFTWHQAFLQFEHLVTRRIT